MSRRSGRSPFPMRDGRRSDDRYWRGALGAIVALVSAGLVSSAVSPVWAGEPRASADGSAAAGSFTVGDGLEAAFDERDGSVRFSLLAGGLTLTRDSKAGGGDLEGFGPGWGLGLARIGTLGGVQVFPASGGSYEPDASHPSGLSAYGVEDVRFIDEPGVLPGREAPSMQTADPVAGLPEHVADVHYRFVLHELGGSTTYFDEAGDPVVHTTALGERTDWFRDRSTPERLIAVVNPDGIVTTLDWSTEPDAVLITQAANLPAEIDPITGEAGRVPVWRVELDLGRVVGLVDPLGGRTTVGYDAATGLVSALSGPSGSVTRVDWRAFDDGIPRAERVRVTDLDGRELSARAWAPGDGGRLASGWPVYGGEGALFRSRDRAAGYTTVSSDGPTRIVSEYTSQHRIVDRRTVVTTSAGEVTAQQHHFTYPGTDGGDLPDPEALPPNWSRPTTTEIVHRDVHGNERISTQSAEFDALGREVSRTDADGTRTTTRYDPIVPAGSALPVGRPVVETRTGPDGLVEEVRSTLDASRTAVIGRETFAGRAGEDALTRIGLAQFEVAPDGAVTAQRMYPSGDAGATPVLSRWDQVVDLDGGTLTTTETLAAGTTAAATTAEVRSLRHGGTLTTTDAVGNASSTAHDALGRPVRSIDAAGNVTTIVIETAQHDGRNATTTTGADGVAVTEIRDALGRVERLTDNIDHGAAAEGYTRVVQTRSYPEPGLMTVTDAWGATTTARSDAFGRTIRSTGATGLTEVTVYDDVANTVTKGLTATGSLDDAEQISTEAKDERGRAIAGTGTRRDGVAVPEVRSAYDGLGRLTTSSAGALSTAIEYDAFGHAVDTVVTPDDERASAMTATRRFDGFGFALEKTLSSGDDQRSGGALELDELGRTVRETDQVGRVAHTAYTPDGLVARVAVDGGATVDREYDPITRHLVESTTSSPVGETVRTGYEYDPRTGEVLAVFDPADRAATEISYTYDAHRNPLTVGYPDGTEIVHAYDEHGRRTRTDDAAGNRTEFAYAPEGLMTRATQRDARGDVVAEVTYAYDEFGRATSLTRGNGVTTAYTFTSASQVATELTTDRDGRVLTDRVYTYDARGNVVQRVDRTLQGGADEAATTPTTTTTEYSYDAFDRLLASTLHDGEATGPTRRHTEYELSVSGDIRSETTTERPGTPSESTTTRAFEYSPLGELTGRTTTTRSTHAPDTDATVRRTQEYDAAGNLTTSFDGTRHTYDAANRPVLDATTDGVARRTAYWADGTRREVTTSDPTQGTTTGIRFYWDDTDLLNEIHTGDAGGEVAGTAPPGGVSSDQTGVASYLLGAGRHARSTVDDAGTFRNRYFGADRHGNVTELIDADGTIGARATYTDYGSPSIDTGDAHPSTGLQRNPFGFAGEYTDDDGTQHLRTRTYGPDDHRFTTKDVAQLHNLYAFADLNPIMNVDPTGRAAEPDWARIGNWVTLGVSIALTLVGLGSLGSMLWTVRGATALGAVGMKVAAVSGWEWIAISLGLGFDLASVAGASALAYYDTVGTFENDAELMKHLLLIDAGVSFGAMLTGYFAARAITRRTKLASIELKRLRVAQVQHEAPLVVARPPDQPMAVVIATHEQAQGARVQARHTVGPPPASVPIRRAHSATKLPTVSERPVRVSFAPGMAKQEGWSSPPLPQCGLEKQAFHDACFAMMGFHLTQDAGEALQSLQSFGSTLGRQTDAVTRGKQFETMSSLMRQVEAGAPKNIKEVSDLWGAIKQLNDAAALGKVH